jgi:hypothetical protein
MKIYVVWLDLFCSFSVVYKVVMSELVELYTRPKIVYKVVIVYI